MRPADLDFFSDGAALRSAVLSDAEVTGLLNRLGDDLEGRPGRRLLLDEQTRGLMTANGKVGAVAAAILGQNVQPVRAVLFDKTRVANWIVAWHQDRTIAVRERHSTPGFGPWSVKDGIVHVAPPIEVLNRMVTLRVHLDACTDDNAPLIVALGSHRLGRVPADEVEAEAMRHPRFTCHAAAGDVWTYSTPILHTSGRSVSDGRRRVLQLDYAADALPGGLEWMGVTRQR